MKWEKAEFIINEDAEDEKKISGWWLYRDGFKKYTVKESDVGKDIYIAKGREFFSDEEKKELQNLR